MVEPLDLFHADLVLAGNFPEAVAGDDGVDFLYGLWGSRSWGWRSDGGLHLNDGWLGDEAGKEPLDDEGVVERLWGGLFGKGVEQRSGALPDGVGAGSCEEFFCDIFDSGGVFGVEIEQC